MPGLMDILGNLDAHSNLIHDAAAENNVPDGPFVTAYLRGIESLSSTIREAQSHEVKLFKFVGDQTGGTGKVVEKRDKGLVTPLRKAGLGDRVNMTATGARGTTPARYSKADSIPDSSWDNPQILLNTAFTLTEEYRAMPRAKAHIRNLLDQYIETQSKISELEAAIVAVESGNDSRTQPKTADSGRGDSEVVEGGPDPDDWIKAEEAALKALEAEVAERRRSKRLTAQDTGTPPNRTMRKLATPGSASPLLPQLRKGMTPSAHSPLLSTSMHGGLEADHLSTPTPAPAATQQPASVFKRASARRTLAVSRTMEATRGQIKTISSAAKHSLLTSHRSPAARLSASPDVKSSPPIRSQPAKPTAAATATQPSIVKTQINVSQGPTNEAKEPNTVNLAPALPSAPIKPEENLTITNEEEAKPLMQERTPTKANILSRPPASDTVTPKSKARKAIEGVEIRSETRQAIDKIWEVFGEVIRSDEEMQDTTGKPDPEQTIRALAKLAGSVPQPPLSPSSVSTLSNPAPRPPAARIAPLTTLVILQCVAIINILRAPGMNISKNELSEVMTAHAVAKGWDKSLGQKALLGCVGRRVLKIDRRGTGGGTVMFNL